MAEIVKKKVNTKEYKVKELEKNVEESSVKKVQHKSSKKNSKSENKSLWSKFMIFCHGVGSEVKRIHWTNKKDMLKYSVATIFFVIFCSLFFYLIDVIFALVQSLFA